MTKKAVSVLTFTCWSAATFAAPSSSRADGISYRADTITRPAHHTVKATGNVALEGDRFRLQADSVMVRESPRAGELPVEIIASGHVVLTRGEERLTLQRLQLDPRTGAGIFQLPQIGEAPTVTP